MVEIESLNDLPDMPFCSERCRMADLNRWLSGRYVISRPMGEEDIDQLPEEDLPSPEDDWPEESSDDADE